MSLRFPRFLRVREDKGLEEASSEEFLADLWRKQMVKAPAPKDPMGDDGNDEDNDDDDALY